MTIEKFLNHPVLDAYLKMNLIVSLLPTTLIPLGVLMAVYSTMTTKEVTLLQKGGTLAGGVQLASLTDPLMTLYMKMFNIPQLTAMTLVPFAFILGRDIFSKVLKSYTKKSLGQSQSGGGGGGAGNLLSNIPILETFLQVQGGAKLTPATLVPLGILGVVYHYIQKTKKTNNNKQSGGSGMPAFLNTPALSHYLQMMGISSLTPQTLLPFALVISKQLFDKYVRQHAVTMHKLKKSDDDTTETTEATGMTDDTTETTEATGMTDDTTEATGVTDDTTEATESTVGSRNNTMNGSRNNTMNGSRNNTMNGSRNNTMNGRKNNNGPLRPPPPAPPMPPFSYGRKKNVVVDDDTATDAATDATDATMDTATDTTMDTTDTTMDTTMDTATDATMDTATDTATDATTSTGSRNQLLKNIVKPRKLRKVSPLAAPAPKNTRNQLLKNIASSPRSLRKVVVEPKKNTRNQLLSNVVTGRKSLRSLTAKNLEKTPPTLTPRNTLMKNIRNAAAKRSKTSDENEN